ncbi:MAG: hypothetical protein COY81_00970 [Candidatus Pacebacteria bacterium CG_4_10_14_0_8_um_filter_43_12]|nr:MAG: hypothetical protein COU66_03920 [Candidatus Pacebacteria bacterium CG10_big_fil_rev_8_21_14_0_10_44_11]PIY79719.1 MAG: hypothetical protein COY81_00970 [Candidatus Pacebacteria bacterium CG_4_10_14_0_8_um_filter_43_12]
MPVHEQLAQGRWQELTFLEQMANVGSEVERAISWRNKNQKKLMLGSITRAFELLSLTIDAQRESESRLKELCRVKECLADSFLDKNSFLSSDGDWKSYFRSFTYAANVKAGR